VTANEVRGSVGLRPLPVDGDLDIDAYETKYDCPSEPGPRTQFPETLGGGNEPRSWCPMGVRQGVILSGTRDWLTMGADGGESLVIRRDTIVDIDHPGDELAIVGAALFGLGAIVGVAGMAGGDWADAYAGGAGFALAGVGAAVGIAGWATWGGSVSAAAEP